MERFHALEATFIVEGPKRSPPRPPDSRSPKSSSERSLNLFKRWNNLSTSWDTTKTFLTALHQSADAFPLLKSVCGNVLVIWNIADRIKSSRKDAQALAMRCAELVKVIEGSVPDPSALSSEMQENIAKFNKLLVEVIAALEQIQKQKWYTRLDRLNRNEDVLRTLNRRVDEHHRDFNTFIHLQNYYDVREISKRSKLVQEQIETLDAKFECILGRFSFAITVGFF